MMKKRVKKTETLASLRKKLYSALAMLLVSSIMMVSSSYAWFVLSTAPEVSGIETQVGANGSLEIALLNTESYNDITKIAEADIDESATDSLMSSNYSWGNLVDLSESTYGLSQIVLNPSRLYIEAGSADDNGVMSYSIGNTLLKTPIYGEDGRITGLDKTSAVTATLGANNTFEYNGTTSYGVRAIGTAASMSIYQLGLNSAKNELLSNQKKAKNAASIALNTTGDAIGNIAVTYALAKDGAEAPTYTDADVKALKDLATGLEGALDYIELALRQVYMGYICTETANLDTEAYLAEQEYITNESTTLLQLHEKYPIDNMKGYIDDLNKNRNDLQDAIDACDAELAKGAPHSQSALLDIMLPLVKYENITLAGKTVNELKELLGSDNGISELFSIVTNGGLVVSVPSESGILSEIADFTGDYEAEVTVAKVEYGGFKLENASVTMTTATTVKPVYLTACSNLLKTFTAGSDEGAGSLMTDYYGYALDLAFRTNAEESNLLLQTDAVQRIYDDGANAATQGSGSYMEFTPEVGYAASKMIKLMDAIRVVFVDSESNVLALAKLDTTLGKDAYNILSASGADDAENPDGGENTEGTEGSEGTGSSGDADKIAQGKHAVLKFTKQAQNSDYIKETAYNSLPDTSAVTYNETTGAVKAPLYLYNFKMTESLASQTPGVAKVETLDESGTGTQEENGENGTGTGSGIVTEKKYTGGITVLEKKDGSTDTLQPIITPLEENEPMQVTAIVYLDGSFVSNAIVAAESTESMTGTLNLQFASDAGLMPMNNQKLRDGADEPESDPDENENQEGNGNSGTTPSEGE